MTEQDRTAGPPRKVLLATDLSARCDRALDRAATLATAWNAELVVVHALEQPDDFYAQDLERRLPSWRRAPDPAHIIESQIRNDLAQSALHIVAIAEKSEPSDLVLRAAQTHGCDLIVTGIARDETLGRFGLGATVDRLIRRSHVPLLIVKQRVRGAYGNILVATDFSEASRCALHCAMTLFPDHPLGIFHAYDPPLAGITEDPKRFRDSYRAVATADYAAFLAGAGVSTERQAGLALHLEEGNPISLIGQYARDRRADLVVLGTHGRGALFDILIGSTAKEILSAVPCDVLLVREPRARAGGSETV